MASKARLRVAIISFDFGRSCVAVAGALSEDADVLLALPESEVPRHMQHLLQRVSLFSFPKPRIRQVVKQFRLLRRIFREVHNFAPDVIHYQGIHLWLNLCLPLLRRYPLVLSIHDFQPHPGDQPLQQTPFWIETLARRRADQLIVHSRHVQQLVTQHMPDVAGHVSAIPLIQVAQESDGFAGEEEKNLVLFFGRIWPYKGLEYLIRAEPLISARVPGVRILIAGTGEGFSRYRRMMTHPERFVVVNEYIPEKRAPEYMRRAAVVVLPYIEASQSGVIPMAYTAGKPVVATTVGGLPEMVEDGRTGILVPPRNVERLADAVTRLLLDEPLRRQMGTNAKRKIDAECSPAVVAAKTMEAYRQAIERKAGHRARAVPAPDAFPDKKTSQTRGGEPSYFKG